MTTRGYTVLGWIVWQIGSRLMKYEIRRTRTKLGAAGVVLLVALGGILAARASGDES